MSHISCSNCESFRSLPLESRISKLKEFKVCFNCLRFGHAAKKCFLSHCKYCKEKHNTLLHVEKSEQSASHESSSSSSNDIVLTTDVLPVTTPTRVFLSTALVRVVDGKSNKHTARAILDDGSGINIISEAFCSKLGLPRRNVSSAVSGHFLIGRPLTAPPLPIIDDSARCRT